MESKDVKEELIQAKERLSKEEAANCEMKKVIQENEEKIESLTKDTNGKIEKLKKKLNVLESKNIEQETQINQSKQNEILIIKLKAEINELHARKALNSQKFEELTLEKSSALNNYEKLFDQFKLLEIDYGNKNFEIEKCKNSVSEIESKIIIITNEKKELEENLSSEIKIKEKILLELSETVDKNNLLEGKYSESINNFEIISKKYENFKYRIINYFERMNKFYNSYNNEEKSNRVMPNMGSKKFREISKKLNNDFEGSYFNEDENIDSIFMILNEQFNYLCKYISFLDNENKLFGTKINDLEAKCIYLHR